MICVCAHFSVWVAEKGFSSRMQAKIMKYLWCVCVSVLGKMKHIHTFCVLCVLCVNVLVSVVLSLWCQIGGSTGDVNTMYQYISKAKTILIVVLSLIKEITITNVNNARLYMPDTDVMLRNSDIPTWNHKLQFRLHIIACNMPEVHCKMSWCALSQYINCDRCMLFLLYLCQALLTKNISSHFQFLCLWRWLYNFAGTLQRHVLYIYEKNWLRRLNSTIRQFIWTQDCCRVGTWWLRNNIEMKM